MRTAALLSLLAVCPAVSAARETPSAIALELGFTGHRGPGFGEATAIGLVATVWLVGALDATARVAWASVRRPDGRGADGALAAGAGLRYDLFGWPAVQLQLAADLAWVEMSGRLSPAAGLEAGVGCGIEAALGREVGLGLELRGSQLLGAPESGPGLGGRLRLAFYF